MDKNLAYEARTYDLGEWLEGPWVQELIESPDGDHYQVTHKNTGTILATLPAWAGPIALWMCVARDALPVLLAEQRAPDAIEYGIRIPNGDVLMSGSALDRQEQEERLTRYRDTWPQAVLVQRAVTHGDWAPAEATDNEGTTA